MRVRGQSIQGISQVRLIATVCPGQLRPLVCVSHCITYIHSLCRRNSVVMPVIHVKMSTRTSDQVNAPILCRLAKDFDVVTNIRRASISEDYGSVELDIEGDLEEAQRAVSWLHTTGLQVEAMERSVGRDTANL